MSREYKLFVLDVIEFCSRVLRYTKGKDEAEFFADEMALDAVLSYPCAHHPCECL